MERDNDWKCKICRHFNRVHKRVCKCGAVPGNRVSRKRLREIALEGKLRDVMRRYE